MRNYASVGRIKLTGFGQAYKFGHYAKGSLRHAFTNLSTSSNSNSPSAAINDATFFNSAPVPEVPPGFFTGTSAPSASKQQAPWADYVEGSARKEQNRDKKTDHREWLNVVSLHTAIVIVSRLKSAVRVDWQRSKCKLSLRTAMRHPSAWTRKRRGRDYRLLLQELCFVEL